MLLSLLVMNIVFMIDSNFIGNTKKQDSLEEVYTERDMLRFDPTIEAYLNGDEISQELVTDEIFVELDDISQEKIMYLEDQYNIQSLNVFQETKLILFKDPGFISSKSLLSETNVKSVWGNHKIKLTTPIRSKTTEYEKGIPVEEFVDFNEEIGANDLKAQGINGTSVTIAFIDTGVDITGQLSGGDLDDFDDNTSTNDFKFFGATSMSPDDPFYYSDFSGRGTWHAGLACGTGYYNNTYEGVAPGAKYLSIKAFDPLGITYYSSLISGVEWAIRNSADIILFSESIPGLPNDPISKACDEAVGRGIMVVSPSGNEGSSYMSIGSPGHSLKSLTVGAYNSLTGTISDFSSRGPILFDFRQGLDLIAPGVGLVSTRANILPSGSIESVSNSLMSSSSFGEVVQENYSRASGTGAAAAIVAGAAALLLQEFPQATPEVLRIALTTTATPITGDSAAEGSGLINVKAARDFLLKYFQRKVVDVFPIPSQAIYPGIITAADSLNISSSPTRPENWSAIDSAISMTTHTLTSILLVNQTDFANASDFHLLFSLWGIEYNDKFHWLFEFNVVKELYLSTLQPLGTSQYTRYVGILSNDEIYVVMAIETWAYTDSIQQRMAAFNFEFTVINQMNADITNISLVNICKADLYLNEYNITDQSLENLTQSLPSALDDIILFNETEEVIIALDSNQNRTSAELNNTAIGFKSSTHNVSQWEIGDFISILMNISSQQPLKDNITYTQGEDDPAWGISWLLTDRIQPSSHETFEAQLAIGLGNETLSALKSLNDQFYFLQENCTVGQVLDLQIIEPSFHRILYLNKQYRSETRVINVGTVIANDTAIIYLVNRSNQVNRFELYVLVQQYSKIGMFEFFEVESEWFPIYSDTYTLAWVAVVIQESVQNVTALAEFAGIADALPDIVPSTFSTTPLITSYQARNCVVIDGEFYLSLADDFARGSPDVLDLIPMVPNFPGDIAIWNLTYFSIYNISGVNIVVEGLVKDWVDINESFLHFNNLQPYTTIPITVSVPFMAGPGKYELNVSFQYQSGKKLLVIPIVFVVHAVTGRIWFDAIHNNITLSTTESGFSFEWDERLDTPYGNFYNLKSLWSSPRMFNLSGSTLQPLISGLGGSDMEINLTDMGLNMGDLGEMERFLPESLKGYSFRGDTISMSYLDTNLLQIGDILILSDPEVPYSAAEIRNVSSYVANGGIVFFWVEPEHENNWTSINQLLNEFGLEINTTTKGVVNEDILFSKSIFNISFQDPVSFKQKNTSLDPNIISIDLISNYLAFVGYGRGKIALIGDKDLFNNTGLNKGDNSRFSEALLHWALSNRTEISVSLTDREIEHGQKVYFDLTIDNYEEVLPYLKEGYIWIYSIVGPDGQEIVIGKGNQSFPINPIFPGEPGHFLAQFDSRWTNLSGQFHIVFYFDHVALVSQIYFASFTILDTNVPSVQDYIDAAIPYDHRYDFLLLTAMVTLFLIQRQYRSHKWSRRFRIVELKEPTILAEARTYLAEAEMLTKSLNQALLYSKYSELEKIRLLLRIRRRMNKLFSSVKRFGDKLGEI